jgi:hypothetical protein
VLERARGRLSEVRATQAAVHSASLISRIDQPETGLHPTGPSRAMVVLTGMLGGLLIGMGTMFLTIGPEVPTTHSAHPSTQTILTSPPDQISQPPATSAANAPSFSPNTVSSLYVGMPLGEAMGNVSESTIST